ncbi:MAG: PQQ-binding-like beta-propeller repeat protein [Planctomycetota bacterium]|nr:PQQ-binding-like beta-propeller repeat protein [Planctomycetota bacterium]
MPAKSTRFARRWGAACLAVVAFGSAFSAGELPGPASAPSSGPAPATSPASVPATRPDPLPFARVVFGELLNYSNELPAADRKQIPLLVARLAGANWQKRQEASAALEAMPPAAIPLLTAAVRGEGIDLETLLRAKAAIAAIERRALAGDSRLNAAIEARALAQEPGLIADLIALLDHPAGGVRYAADYALRTLTTQTIDYNAFADASARAAAIKAWQAWWAQAKGSFRFAPGAFGPLAILAIDFQGSSVTAYKLDGTELWSRRCRHNPYGAWPTGNGNLLVAYINASPTLEELDPDGNAVWTSQGMNIPNLRVVDVRVLPNGRFLLVDIGAQRVIEVDRQGAIAWQAGPLNNPMSAERLNNGNTLVTESATSAVIEIDPTGKTVWTAAGIANPMDATRLLNGNTLVAEVTNQRVVELDRDGRQVWQRPCQGIPYGVLRLSDGTTVIAVREEGVIVVDTEGRVLRRLRGPSQSLQRLRLVPQALLEKK